ncbi:hypothetical protein M378DRAFT_1054207 [Amanita muscaria Koide BX008]|uniref:Uncharacterized protein n=1 Tax=Amanita muscaria (strain Koide BX008) TaxID=946122 RepID=A0A0C2X4R7_AMAMK|nr:hypothetical protein M378DRAFT_1054207 [Amanita muscaria Koide BX008]
MIRKKLSRSICYLWRLADTSQSVQFGGKVFIIGVDWGDRRLTVQEIKNHSFFFGALNTPNRTSLVPRLQSITDTSYFPTEDLLSSVSSHSEKAEAMEKDLAFLGYVAIPHSPRATLTFDALF